MNEAQEKLKQVLIDGKLTAADKSELFNSQYGDGLFLLFWAGVLVFSYAFYEAIRGRSLPWFIVGLVVTFITFFFDAKNTKIIFTGVGF